MTKRAPKPMVRPRVPPPDDADCVPDHRAVWRDPRNLPDGPADTRISVEYGALIERTTIGKARWSADVTRWRFGWPPKGGR